MTTAEKIAVMQAYVDGKQIEMRPAPLIIDGAWVSCEKEPGWDWETMEYRIKPEIIYRPYKNTEEMIADFEERFRVNCPPYAMPMIWLSKKDISEYSLITDYDFEDGVCTSDMGWDLKELFGRFTYLDGSPVGKLVEE